MSRLTKTLPLAPLLLCVAMLCASTSVAADTPPVSNYADAPEMRGLLQWEHFAPQIYFEPSDLATKERKSAVQAGFDQWVQATRNFVHYQVVTKPAQVEVTVTFLPQESIPAQSGACGHTTMTFLTLTLKSARIVLAKTDVPLVDLQANAAHEFGHTLGIDGHSDGPADLMYAVLTRSDADSLPLPSHTLTTRDLNTLRISYPAFVGPPVPSAKPAPEAVGFG